MSFLALLNTIAGGAIVGGIFSLAGVFCGWFMAEYSADRRETRARIAGAASRLCRTLANILGDLRTMAPDTAPGLYLGTRDADLRRAAARLDGLVRESDRADIEAHIASLCGEQCRHDRQQALDTAQRLHRLALHVPPA